MQLGADKQMYELANIVGVKKADEKFYIQIELPLDFEYKFKSMNVDQVGLWIEDGRTITAVQRKKIYATIQDISKYTGYVPEEAKEWLKYEHVRRSGAQYFSLKNCSIDTAKEFINTLIDFSLENGVQIQDLLTNRTDDINHMLYKCLVEKKCCICGKEGEIHHVDAIGMGNDRKRYDDSLNKKICLCRKHHTNAHSMGNDRFTKMYHVYGIQFE